MLEPVLATFPPHGGSSSTARIASTEIAYDVPLPAHLSYEKCERLLQELAKFLIPYQNRYAELSSLPSNKFKDCADGSRNGKLTFNIGKQENLIEEENSKKEKRIHADTS